MFSFWFVFSREERGDTLTAVLVVAVVVATAIGVPTIERREVSVSRGGGNGETREALLICGRGRVGFVIAGATHSGEEENTTPSYLLLLLLPVSVAKGWVKTDCGGGGGCTIGCCNS